MKRGDIVTIATTGDYGKPRPAVVIQSDLISETGSVLVALITSSLVEAPIFRLTLEPTETNGLNMPSQIMVDKILAIPREKCGKMIGRVDQITLVALNNMLSVMIGLAD